MIYRTHTIPVLQASFSPTHFLLNSLVFHMLYLARKTLRPKPRSAATVQRSYDAERGRMLEALDTITWDDYVGFSKDYHDYIVMNYQLRWGTLREARELLLNQLVETVRQKVQPGQTVMEFGSGDGRNLLYLQKQFPNIHFVGLELSPISVEVSKKAAEKFGISGIEFYQANACVPLPAHISRSNIGLIYTSFALEQMPRIFAEALENMLKLSPTSIALFEPIPELWGSGLRARVARLRVHAIDRLQHLPSVLNTLLETYPHYTLSSITRSGIAINPHTEMCKVIVDRK